MSALRDVSSPRSQPGGGQTPLTPSSRRLLVLGGLVLAVGLAWLLRGVIVPLLFAFLLAYLLDPVVSRLARLGIRRPLGAPLVMTLLVGAVVTTAFFAVPFLVEQFGLASQKLPAQISTVRAQAEGYLSYRFGYHLPATWGEVFGRLGTLWTLGSPSGGGGISEALFGTVNAIFVFLGTLVIPVLALYLLIDFDGIVLGAGRLVPRRWAPAVLDVATEIHSTLSNFVRGQMLTSAVLAGLYGGALSMLGVRLGAAIGILTGMLAFVPYVGLGLGVLLATVMTLLEWRSPAQLVAVVTVMVGIGVLDGMVITPRIVGGSVGLRPIEVLIALMVAATLFGFPGVLVAVPLGAITKILLRRALQRYERSRFYRRVPSADPPELSRP